MYYKNCLPLKVLDISDAFMKAQILIYESVTNYLVSLRFTDHLTNHMMILNRF